MADGAAPSGGKEWLAGVFDRAAPTYDRVGDAYHDVFGERLVDFVDPAAGDRVLDVACGRGAVLLPAARRVGEQGRVHGVDLSPSMVVLAAEALAVAGLDGDVDVMDAEHLAVPAGSYDSAFCAFGLFFFPDPERAVAELHRALRPGGVVGLSTWGADDERWSWEDDLLARLKPGRRAIVRPFDDPADVEALLVGAGFGNVTHRVAEHEVRFADADAWWAWKWSYSLRGVLEQQDAATLDEVRRAAAEHLEPLMEPGGVPCRLVANLVRAHKPAGSG
jgi:ubiquinone/menaquinone biosynthesis C-methylase UbiE